MHDLVPRINIAPLHLLDRCRTNPVLPRLSNPAVGEFISYRAFTFELKVQVCGPCLYIHALFIWIPEHVSVNEVRVKFDPTIFTKQSAHEVPHLGLKVEAGGRPEFFHLRLRHAFRGLVRAETDKLDLVPLPREPKEADVSSIEIFDHKARLSHSDLLHAHNLLIHFKLDFLNQVFRDFYASLTQ